MAGPPVVAKAVDGIEGADVQLVDNEVFERRRAKLRIVPGIGRCIGNHAIPIRSDDFAGVRIALEPVRSAAGHEELVLIAALYAGKEAGPVSVGILDQPTRLLVRAPDVEGTCYM